MLDHFHRESIMQVRRLFAAALTLGCLLLGGCREHNEPVKPIAPASAPAQPA